MGYLVIKGNNQTKSYPLSDEEPSKPYLKVNSEYLSLTSADTTGLKLNVETNGSTYRPIQSTTENFTDTLSSTYTESSLSTFTSVNSAHTTTRSSSYSASTPDGTIYYGSKITGYLANTTSYKVTPLTFTRTTRSYSTRATTYLTYRLLTRSSTVITEGMASQLYYSTISIAGGKRAIVGSFLNNVTSSKNGYLNKTSITYTSKMTGAAVLTNASITNYAFASALSSALYMYVTGTFSGSGAKQLSHSFTTLATSVTNSSTTSKSSELSRASEYIDYYYTQSQTNTETKTNVYTVATTRTTTSL